MTHIPLLIVGGGPIGMSCGIAAQQAGIEYKILEKGCLINSLANFPTDMTFFSSSDKLELAGIPFTSLALRPSKQEALEYYRRIAQKFELNIGFYERFESMERLPDESFYVVTSKGEYTCNYIVNATGFYDAPKLLNIPGESLDKVKHYFTSAHHLFHQKVAVIGASNSAVDVALEAYRKGADVTMIVRKEAISPRVKYWVKPDVEARIAEGNIKVHFKAEVQKIKEDHLIFKQKNKAHRLENDFVYAMTGYKPNIALTEAMGVKFDDTITPHYNPETMESNAAGVYLAGVVCGGMNTRKWFIENTRDHGDKIMKHIVGQQNT